MYLNCIYVVIYKHAKLIVQETCTDILTVCLGKTLNELRKTDCVGFSQLYKLINKIVNTRAQILMV